MNRVDSNTTQYGNIVAGVSAGVAAIGSLKLIYDGKHKNLGLALFCASSYALEHFVDTHQIVKSLTDRVYSTIFHFGTWMAQKVPESAQNPKNQRKLAIATSGISCMASLTFIAKTKNVGLIAFSSSLWALQYAWNSKPSEFKSFKFFCSALKGGFVNGINCLSYTFLPSLIKGSQFSQRCLTDMIAKISSKVILNLFNGRELNAGTGLLIPSVITGHFFEKMYEGCNFFKLDIEDTKKGILQFSDAFAWVVCHKLGCDTANAIGFNLAQFMMNEPSKIKQKIWLSCYQFSINRLVTTASLKILAMKAWSLESAIENLNRQWNLLCSVGKMDEYRKLYNELKTSLPPIAEFIINKLHTTDSLKVITQEPFHIL